MKFSVLATYFQKLENTSSRNEMTKILASLLKEASLGEVAPICYLSLGRLAPLYQSVEFNLGEKMMLRVLAAAYSTTLKEVTKLMGEKGDLGEVCWSLSTHKNERPSRGGKTVTGIYKTLLSIANDEGKGSQDRKVRNYAKLLSEVDPLSAKYIARLPVGALRLGFSDQTLLDALSWMEKGDKSLKKDIERAFNAAPDIGLVAEVFKKKGLAGLSSIKIEVGRPILPQRCQRVETAAEMMERMGESAAVEPKFDGTRIQVHLGVTARTRTPVETPDFVETQDLASLQEALIPNLSPPTSVTLFSRGLEDMTEMFPDLAQAVCRDVAGNVSTAILDGEALGYDVKSGKFVAFQETIKRKRKHGVKEKMEEIPLRLFIFDVLYLDGKSLLNTPFKERREILEKIIKDSRDAKSCVSTRSCVSAAPQKIVHSADELQKEFDDQIAAGLEGVVVKSLDGVYEAGARGYSWIKFKGALDTVDCVVLGYNFGRGKRAGFGIGAFLIGIYDKKTDKFLTVSKIGTGPSDAQWEEMKKRCDKLAVKEKPSNVVISKTLIPDVWVKPEMVVEIGADEITKSPAHTAKYALRFPRLVGWRDDRQAEDATTVKEIERMYKGKL